MDSAFDYLLTQAEVGVGFVAVSAILILFRQVRGGELSPYQMFVIQMFIEVDVVMIHASLLPILLHGSGIEEPWLWRAPSLALGVLLLGYFVVYWRRRPKNAELGPTHPTVVFNIGGSYLAAGLLIANGMQWASRGVYLLGIAWLLMLMTVMLVAFVRIFFRSDATIVARGPDGQA